MLAIDVLPLGPVGTIPVGIPQQQFFRLCRDLPVDADLEEVGREFAHGHYLSELFEQLPLVCNGEDAAVPALPLPSSVVPGN